MNYPQLLVLKEKYGDWYYLINDRDHLYVTALDILTRRFNEEYWYFEYDPMYKRVIESIETNNGKIAWNILDERGSGGYAYETVDLCAFDNV